MAEQIVFRDEGDIEETVDWLRRLWEKTTGLNWSIAFSFAGKLCFLMQKQDFNFAKKGDFWSYAY